MESYTNLIESSTQFSFHLDGESEIDATILARAINDMAELTKIAVQEQDASAYLKMNVTAFKNGSFQIDFSAVCKVAQTLMDDAPAAMEFAAAIVTVLAGFIKVKKHLKNRKAKSIEGVSKNRLKITNEDGEEVIVPKASGAILNNPKIDNLVINITQAVQEHNPQGGFTLSSQEETVYCSGEDVKSMSFPLPIEQTNICKKTRIEAALVIKKPDILGRSKWGFRFKDRSIEASIEDEEFLDLIHNGETIKAGDFILSTLEVCVDLDAASIPIEETEKYTVLKVHGPIRRQQDYTQLKLE